MDIFGIKKRRKRKEVEDALYHNLVVYAWMSKRLKEVEAKGDEQQLESLCKGCERALEVIENQRKFLYG